MLEDAIHQTEQLPIDEISSAQILEFCDAKLFLEPLQNPQVTSCSNYCYEDYNSSSYTTSLPLPPKIDKFPNYQDNNSGNTDTNPAITPPTGTTTSTSTSTTAAITQNPNNNNSSSKSHNDISIIFDSQEDIDNDISASIDFSPSLIHSIQQDQFDFFSVQQQISLADSVVEEFAQYHAESIGPFMVPSAFEEDCLSSIPSYMHLNSSSPSFLAHAIGSYLPTTSTTSSINPIASSTDSSGILATSILMSSNEFQQQELEYQGEYGGIYCPDLMQQVFNPGDLQGLSTESQQLVSGSENAASLTQDIPNIEDQTFKVGKLSAEQRKEKIHRYMKKRNERNFSKKIKYACRKMLADSRPRVRGRFAKNDEFSETPRSTSNNNHEEEEDEEEVVKEDDMVGSSDIFSHITGVNSFKCNFSIHSLSNY